MDILVIVQELNLLLLKKLLNTDQNWIWANITSFSAFGPFGEEGGDGEVPEFSDLGWILAGVLGMGGFFAIRKRNRNI